MMVPESERLLFRPFEESDAAFLFELMNSPGWLAYIGDRQIRSQADARQYIAKRIRPSYEQFGFGTYLLARKENGEPIGTCGLVQRDYLPAPDLGYSLLPAYTGKGFAWEAARAMVQHSKAVLHLQQLLAIVMPENSASINLLNRLAFESQGPVTVNNETLLLYKKDL